MSHTHTYTRRCKSPWARHNNPPVIKNGNCMRNTCTPTLHLGSCTRLSTHNLLNYILFFCRHALAPSLARRLMRKLALWGRCLCSLYRSFFSVFVLFIRVILCSLILLLFFSHFLILFSFSFSSFPASLSVFLQPSPPLSLPFPSLSLCFPLSPPLFLSLTFSPQGPETDQEGGKRRKRERRSETSHKTLIFGLHKVHVRIIRSR